MVSSSQTAIQRDLLRIRWKEEAFRGSISDMVTPLVELPSVLCDVVEILEGAVRVVCTDSSGLFASDPYSLDKSRFVFLLQFIFSLDDDEEEVKIIYKGMGYY